MGSLLLTDTNVHPIHVFELVSDVETLIGSTGNTSLKPSVPLGQSHSLVAQPNRHFETTIARRANQNAEEDINP